MARKKPDKPVADPRRAVTVLACTFFLGQVLYLASASSAFRLPKEAVVLAGLSLVSLLAAAMAARRNRLVVPVGWLTAVLLALPVLQAVSALWAGSPRRALESALLTLIWVVGALWIATLQAASRRRLALGAGLGAAVSTVVMLLQAAGVEVLPIAGESPDQRFALTGLTGNPADLAMATVMLLPIILVWGETSRSKRVFRVLAGLFVVAAIVTQTLTGLVALAAVAVVWLWQRQSKKLWLGAAAVVVVAIAVTASVGVPERITRAIDAVAAGDFYQLLSARGDGWTAAAQMIADHPATGVGAANFTQFYYPARCRWLDSHGGTGRRGELASHFPWAHCDPLQQVAELSVLGLAWMVALVLAVAGLRKTAGPVLPLATAAFLPFLLLHYPSHLAVGTVPIILLLAHLLAAQEARWSLALHSGRRVVAIVLAVLGVAGALWQLRRVALNQWMGELEQRIVIAGTLPEGQRARLAAEVEAQILQRIHRLPGAAPTLWRTLGHARMLRHELGGAEQAFRTAASLWPHEDAEFQLGIVLAAQGRRNEALVLLARVCRTNPALLTAIPDPDLQRLTTELVDRYR